MHSILCIGVCPSRTHPDYADKRPRELFSADVAAWLERAKLIFSNVFYNEKISSDYEEALRNAYEGCNDYLDDSKALSITSEYIKTVGQLLRYGFLKDPYSGIDNADSKICFVAMWFDDAMNDFYECAIKPAVESLGFDSVRIDKVEHNDRIDAKIFQLIRRARFMVADFSGAREGVYYEAGFYVRLGLRS